MRRIKSVNILFLVLVLIHISMSFSVSFLPGLQNMTINQSLLFSQALIFVPTIIYLMFTRTKIKEFISFQRIKISTIFMVILFTFLMLPLIATVNAISMLFSTNVINETAKLMMDNPFWLNLLLMAILPAINEEFVFRGVFYHSYKEKSVLQGILGCGILFGLMHLNFNQFSYAFLLGTIFALLVEATGSIFAPMIAHFILNGNSVVVMSLSKFLTDAFAKNQDVMNSILKESGQTFEFGTQFTKEELMITIGMFAVVAVITTSLATGVFIWICRNCGTLEHVKRIFYKNKVEVEAEKEAKKKKQSTIVTVPFIIGVVICVIFMILTEISI